jgi:hypothetical protein
MHNRFRLVLPAIPYLIGVGLQVSGRTHTGLAFLAFEVAALIAAGVAWSYWIDWGQTALLGGHPSKLIHRILVWPGLEIPRLPAIRAGLLAAILTFLTCNAAILAFFELTEAAQSRTAKRWEPLSAQETAALRAQWRNFSPEHFSVLCAIPECTDLAESIYDVAHDLNWTGIYASAYFMDNGIMPGIEILSYPTKKATRNKIADSIERATNGRLKISSHEWDTAPSPENANDVNLIVGRMK